MSVLYAAQEKRKVVDLLRLLCHQLLYPRLKGEEQKAVEAHLHKMMQDPRQLGLQFDFEYEPILGITTIKMDIKLLILASDPVKPNA